MKNVDQKYHHGCAGKKVQGWTVKLGIAAVSALCLTAVLSPTQASAAAATPVTQLQYIQILAQALGDAGQFNAGSTAADYIQYAVNKGLSPVGGWSADAPMTAEILALTWIQIRGLDPTKYNRDYFRNLDVDGFHIDRNAVVSHTFMVGFLDQPTAMSATGHTVYLCNTSIKPSNGVGFGWVGSGHNISFPTYNPLLNLRPVRSRR
jgi:hypothetical protein